MQKHKVIAFLIIFLAVGLVGAIIPRQTDKNGNQTEQNAQAETSAKAGSDKDALQVGETADFDDYSITLNSIDQREGFVFASIKIHPHTNIIFEDTYLTARTDEGDEVKNENSTHNMTLGAAEETAIDLYYKDFGINSLKWKNGSEEATWSFDEKVENNRNRNEGAFADKPSEILAQEAAEEAQKAEEEAREQAEAEAQRQAQEAQRQAEEAQRAQEQAQAENSFNIGAGIQALEDYGKTVYPYGFKVSTFGQIALEQRGDNSYFMKYSCKATNIYGAEANTECEAVVTGVGSTPYTYTVQDFHVY